MKTRTQLENFLLVSGLFTAVFFNDAKAASIFPIATNSGFEVAIGAAFDGTNFLVGIEGDETNADTITAQLVSPTGALIGSRIKVGHTGGAPFIAFGGTNYLMVWQDDFAEPNDILTGQRVARNGALVGSSFTIASLSAGQEIWGLATGAGSFLVLYSSGGTDSSYPLYS